VGFACASVTRVEPVGAQPRGFQVRTFGNTLSVEMTSPKGVFMAVGRREIGRPTGVITPNPPRGSGFMEILPPGKREFPLDKMKTRELAIFEVIPRGVWRFENGIINGNECDPPIDRLCVDPRVGFRDIALDFCLEFEICNNNRDDDCDGDTDEAPCG